MDPITLSLAGLALVTGIMILILAIAKPTFVLQPKQDKKINWGKLVSISLVVGLLAAIILYVSRIKPKSIQPDPVTMAFAKPAECY